VRDQHIGAFQIPGMPARFSAWPQATDLSAALLGEHNEEVLRDVLGLDASQIATLYERGVLIRDPLLAEPDRSTARATGNARG